MKNLGRLSLRKYSPAEIEEEVNAVVKWILSVCQPIKIVLIGSALGSNFDDCSDLDFVLIFPSSEEAHQSRKCLYSSARPVSRAVECLCVGTEKFDASSEVGGIYWVAKHEGRTLYDAGS